MKHIVIVGAGFGGLRTARLIGRDLKRMGFTDRYHVTVIDRNRYHTYTPLLYEAATTSPQTASLQRLHEVVVHDIPSLLKDLPIHWIQDEVTALDVQRGQVHLASNTILPAEYLVLAFGVEPNHFNIPGLKEHALNLKTFGDAIAIRNTILNLAKGRPPSDRLTVVVGGAGPTGVEFAGELKAWCGELKAEHAKADIDVVLLEASPSILSSFPNTIVSKALRRLANIGVTVKAGLAIKQVGATSLTLQDGSVMNFDVLIWTGGVKAPALLASAPLKSETRGRIEVASAMQCLPQTPDLNLAPMVYALGDTICFYNPRSGKPMPGVARAAIMQANVVAHNIIADIKNDANKNKAAKRIEYHPMNYPYIIPIGGKYAIAKFGPFIFSGFLGWLFKLAVEFNYLLSIMSFSHALKVWFHGLRIFVKNDRLG